MPDPTTTPPGTGLAGTYYFLDRHIDADGRKYNGVVSGLAVSQSGTPSLTLQVAAGEFHQFNLADPNRAYAGGTITLPAADPDIARIDLISIYFAEGIDDLAHVVVTSGLANDNTSPQPVLEPPQDRDAGVFNIVLATVVVRNGVTEIFDEDIYDRRFFLPFLFSGNVDRLATALIAGGSAPNEVVIWTEDGNLNTSGLDASLLGDVKDSAVSVAAGQVALWTGPSVLHSIYNATSSGRPLLTAGVLSVAPVNLGLEVTGDLPLVNLVPASAASRLLGRGSASAGDYEEVSLGAGLTMTGAVLAATAGSSSGPFASAQGVYHTDNSERNLLSFTVPGGTLGTAGGLLWFITARVFSNSGTNNWTLRIKFGATTLMGEVSPTLSNNANPRAITMWGVLWSASATGGQFGAVQGAVGVTTAGSIAGFIDINAAGTATSSLIEGSGTSFEDSTADKVFTVSGQFAISNAAVSIEWKAAAYLI